MLPLVARKTGKHDDGTIDVDEISPEEIPAELLERVADNWDYLTEVHLQVKRGGSWKLLKSGRRVFQETPPTMAVHDICTHLVGVAKRDAEANGENTRYRARLSCKNGEHPYTRWATVRGYIDDDGALQIVDDGSDRGDDSIRVMTDAVRQANAQTFQAVSVVLQMLNGFKTISDTFNGLLGAAGESYAKHVGSQAEILKVQLEMEQNSHQHKERMAKLDKGFGLLEKPVSRIGDEIIETVVSQMRDSRNKKRRKSKANGKDPAAGRPKRSELADTLDAIFETVPEDTLAKVTEYMTENEWKLIGQARKAATDQIFDATFARFVAVLKQRGNEGTNKWILEMTQLLGQDAIVELGMLIKRIEEKKAARAEAARAAEESAAAD